MHFKMFSATCFNLEQSKILSSGNGLTGDQNSDKASTKEHPCLIYLKQFSSVRNV